MITLDYAAIGARIARFRKANGQTAAELADVIGEPMTREILAKIELGKRQTIDVAFIVSIAWALRVPPVALLFNLGTPDDSVTDGLTVSAAVDWFGGWPITGPAKLHGQTPAGLEQSALVLGLTTLIRRARAVEAAEAALAQAGYADTTARSQLARRLEDAKQDLEDTRSALGFD